MGLRDRFKRSGGFLNNVDGLVTALKFTTEPDFGKGPQTPDVVEGKETPLWVEISARQDGSDKNESTHLFAGGADKFVINDDGTSITPNEEGASLWGNTAFDNFYGSYVDNGGSDPEPGEDGTLNFGHVVGARVRFVQVKDETAMKRAAENVKKNKGNARKSFNELGQKKGSDGKYYDLRTLQVSQVYSEGNDVESTPAKAAKPTGQQKSASRTNGSGKANTPAKTTTKASKNTEPDYDVADDSKGVLLDLLADAKENRLKKNDLNALVTRKLVSEPTRREAVRKFLYEDANLQALVEEGAITYSKAGRDQIIALVE